MEYFTPQNSPSYITSLASGMLPHTYIHQSHSFILIILGQSTRPQTSLLHNNLLLTIRTFHLPRITKSLHTQNITKVNTILRLAVRTRTVRYQIVGEDEIVRDCLGGRTDNGCAESTQDEGVDTTTDDFVPDA